MLVQRALATIASLTAVTAIWWVVASLEIFNRAFFPAPPEVWAAAVEMARSGVLWKDLVVSLGRAATGFVIGTVLGIFLGLMTSRVRLINAALSPFLSVIRPIPSIALVPITIVWFGIGEASKYFVISYTVFLAVWLNTHHGMSMIAETYIKASRSLGASRYREFVEVVIPAASPHIMAGIRIAAAVAFLSLVAAD